LIGALTIGSAFPHLLAVASAAIRWRTLILSASALAVGGAVIVLVAVGDGPYVSVTAPFDPRAVLRVFAHRPSRLATLGYLGHMWELYAMWTWMAAFATASVHATTAAAATPPASPAGSALAFITIASGAGGSVAAGLFADRVGKARIASAAMLASGTCAALAGFVFGRSIVVLTILAIVWGVTVVADSAQLSALVAEHSPRDHVGTALTVQTCSGFLLTMASIRLVPVVARTIGWQWAFVCIAPGPFAGAVALRGLTQRRPSAMPAAESTSHLGRNMD
jgi:MFS family permease